MLMAVFPELVPEKIGIDVAIALAIHLLAKLVGDIEQVGAGLHSFKAIEGGQVVYPLGKIRKSGIFEAVFPAVLNVFQVTVGNAVVVFYENVHGLGEQFFPSKVFVDNHAVAEIIYGG